MESLNLETITYQENTLASNSTGDKCNSYHFLEYVELLRLDACRQLEQSKRGQMGQFLTPASVARLMASMFKFSTPSVSLLDAGAGIGSLLAACVGELCQRNNRPRKISVTAYETDSILIEYLKDTLRLCQRECDRVGIEFTSKLYQRDFIKDAARLLNRDLFSEPFKPSFTAAILNPPYRKINAKSETRELLRRIGIETSNLYTGFIAATVKLLAPLYGELVAITPRSFCNGPYFKNFREFFLQEMALQRLHLFDSRQEAFRDDQVLQETVIFHAVKNANKPEKVLINSSSSAEDELILSREIRFKEVVHPEDPEMFIRIVPDGISQQIVEWMAQFKASLEDLGLSVSTGRVVDFRAKQYLRLRPQEGTAPLIYPVNFTAGYVSWPKDTKKPQALIITEDTKALLVPNEHYVLIKRFSSKEEKKRVVAVVHDAERLPGTDIGFENHLNYFHRKGKGLDLTLARGLATFLNSSIVDAFFRQFNGHTQVNATDLRSLKYPSLQQLMALGAKIAAEFPRQEQIDALIKKELLMIDTSANDPIATKKRIEEALEILEALGLPQAQINERSALTLLALLDLGSSDSWQDADHPLRGITPIMDFMAEKYGKRYAPNTRETVRRETVHQSLEAGLIVANPDEPQRPVNSPRYAYQIEMSVLKLLRTYGTSEWDKSIRTYLASVETLRKRYSQEREMRRIPIRIAGETKTLSPGGQNVLVEQIINEFVPRFTPEGTLIYVGDTDEKFAHFDKHGLSALGVEMDAHGKMPDVIVHYTKKNWLVLIEAVTSHGPVNPKRKVELETLFKGAKAGLVFVTAFLSRKAMLEYLPEISWETEVWIAESPSHLIHFNGERFLGPYC